MDIGDMLYILQHFKLNFIPFFIVNTVVDQHLRLDWQIKTEYVFVFKNIIEFLVNIGNHLVV